MMQVMVAGRDLMATIRIGVALAFVAAFLVSVGVSFATGREPDLVLTAPTMLCLAWLYRALPSGEDHQ